MNGKKVSCRIKSGKVAKSVSRSRCKEWLAKQKSIRPYSIEPSVHDLENTDDTTEGAVSTPSLSHLKFQKSSDIKHNVYFACEWKKCNEQFTTDELFSEHIVSHIVNLQQYEGKYICSWDLCYFETTCSSEVTRHIYYHGYHTVLKTFGESICQAGDIPRCTNDSRNRNAVPDLKSDYICAWEDCGKSFKSIYLYHKHIKLHCTFERDIQLTAKKEKKMIVCRWEGCEAQFLVIYRLIEHVRKHTNEKIVGCYHCGGIFRSNTILFNHCKRQLANNTQEYQCAECFKYFASEQLLRQHVVVHVNCLKCTMCNMTCNNYYTLAKHIRYRHLNERPYKCTHCQNEFVCKSDLDRHIERIHEKKIFECGETGCSFSCKTIFLLKRHDAEFHGESPAIYACHCCEKVYKTGKSLSRHLIKIHGFQLPSGHSRFWYRLDESGFYRLQTMRIESLEVTKQILSPCARSDAAHAITSESFEVKVDNNALTLNSTSTDITHENTENNILISISDVDKDGNVIDTKYVKASEIKIG